MLDDPLGQLFAAAELRAAPSECRITGSDPVLRTHYRVGELAATAQAAIGAAATELWELRTGRRQQVHVDLRRGDLTAWLLVWIEVGSQQFFGMRADR